MNQYEVGPRGQLFAFIALHHPGGWRDLRGQDLQIVKVGRNVRSTAEFQ